MSDVGSDVVFADAGVDESVRVAVVLNCSHGSYIWLLKADEGALGLLIITPCLPFETGNTLRVDGIRVVVLGLVLGGREAGKGKEAEGEDRMHCGGCAVVGRIGWG